MSSAGACLSLHPPLSHAGGHLVGSALRLSSNTRHNQSTAPKLRKVPPASLPSLSQDQQRVESAQGPISLLLPVKSEDSHSENSTDNQMNKCRPAEPRNKSDCVRKNVEKTKSQVRAKLEEPNESDPSLRARASSGNCRQSGHMPHPGASHGFDDEAQQPGDGNEQKLTVEDRRAFVESECEEPPLSPRSEKKRMKRFRLNHNQTRFLMSEFSRHSHPDAAQREKLSKEIPGLTPRQVQVWFQNRRAKLKRLTVNDRERMLKSRALPDGFDRHQVLKSPFELQSEVGTIVSSSQKSMASAHTRPLRALYTEDLRRRADDEYIISPLSAISSSGYEFFHEATGINLNGHSSPCLLSVNSTARMKTAAEDRRLVSHQQSGAGTESPEKPQLSSTRSEFVHDTTALNNDPLPGHSQGCGTQEGSSRRVSVIGDFDPNSPTIFAMPFANTILPTAADSKQLYMQHSLMTDNLMSHSSEYDTLYSFDSTISNVHANSSSVSLPAAFPIFDSADYLDLSAYSTNTQPLSGSNRYRFSYNGPSYA